MLRLVHAQTVQGSILVDDIDDGLSNKQVHRLGSSGDPKAYARDGYANSDKQKCYVPRVKTGETAIPGYIDLRQTNRVTLSSSKGKISKMVQAGLVTTVSFVPTDIVTPVVTNGVVDSPGVGDITITGTGFLSVAPDISTVFLSGAGVGVGGLTLTRTQILAGTGGVFTNTSIVIDTLLAPGLAAGDTVRVRADGRLSNIFTSV